jgi:hypothetical protein
MTTLTNTCCFELVSVSPLKKHEWCVRWLHHHNAASCIRLQIQIVAGAFSAPQVPKSGGDNSNSAVLSALAYCQQLNVKQQSPVEILQCGIVQHKIQRTLPSKLCWLGSVPTAKEMSIHVITCQFKLYNVVSCHIMSIYVTRFQCMSHT